MNSTQFLNYTTASLDYVAYWIYTIEGAIIFVFNFLLVIIILGTKKLRNQKEYIIFTGNLLFDVLFGFAYLYAGIRRLMLYYGPVKYVELYPLWSCFFTPHSILFVLIIPGTGFMALATSFDRFFSVFKPLKYILLRTSYAWILICGALLANVPTFIASAYAAWTVNTKFLQPQTCTLNTSIEMLSILEGIRVVTTISAMLLYFPVWRKVYSIIRSSNSQQEMNPKQRQRFMYMTLTMTLITLNELLLFIIPDVYFTIYPDVYSMFLNCLTLNKGTVNIVIFLCTQKELRSAILQRFGLQRDISSQISMHYSRTNRVIHVK